MTKQILEEIELACGQIQGPPVACRTTRNEVDLQIGRLQPQDVGGAAAAQQRADPGEELRQGEGFDEVVVGTQIKAEHPIVDAVARRQNQHGRLDVAFPQRLQDFEPPTTRQHQIQQHEIEGLGVGPKETVLAGRRDHRVVALG